MVKEIIEMQGLDDFMRISRNLILPDSRTNLYNSIVASNITLLSDDLWTDEQLDAVISDQMFIEKAIEKTATEGVSAKVLHRLQLLGKCNPGIRRYILQYISRACM